MCILNYPVLLKNFPTESTSIAKHLVNVFNSPVEPNVARWPAPWQVPPRDTKLQLWYVCQRVNYTFVERVVRPVFLFFSEATFSKSFLLNTPRCIPRNHGNHCAFKVARNFNSWILNEFLISIRTSGHAIHKKHIIPVEKLVRKSHTNSFERQSRSFTLYRPSLISFSGKIAGEKNIPFYMSRLVDPVPLFAASFLGAKERRWMSSAISASGEPVLSH